MTRTTKTAPMVVPTAPMAAVDQVETIHQDRVDFVTCLTAVAPSGAVPGIAIVRPSGSLLMLHDTDGMPWAEAAWPITDPAQAAKMLIRGLDSARIGARLDHGWTLTNP